jgi:hypothetical protein
MFLINFIMQGFLEAWNDDLLDDDSIEKTDDNEIKDNGEGEFKQPVCGV